MFDFLKEVKDLIPNSFYWPRKNYTIKEKIKGNELKWIFKGQDVNSARRMKQFTNV